MESNTKPNTAASAGVQVERDWDNDGFLRISGARTIRLYKELREEIYKLPVGEWGIFFAFDGKAFDEGYADLVSRGLIKEGDKVLRLAAGGFGTREALERYEAEVEARYERIRTEVDPYEVYLHEYNNHECCIDWDGDQRAVEAVVRIYGRERTAEAIEGRRFNANGTVYEIADRMENR